MPGKIQHEDWQSFVALCAAAKTPAQLDDLLGLFLTIEERDALRGRYGIIRELLSGEKSQRDMSRDLAVSITKITRGSNSLKTADPELLAFLQTNILNKKNKNNGQKK